jgi:DNA-binding response OmpR family regulator
MSARILIVDDDKDHAESVADLLELSGYEVELAFTGEQAMARFAGGNFDVTLMDVRLPGMNGVETFFQFRKVRPAARVIMMTGLNVEQLIGQAIRGGALGVLHKPFSTDELLSAVDQAKPRGVVLIVDDDPGFSERAADTLATNGYRVEVAWTGEDALRKVRSGTINCLIVDLQLPIISGIEVCHRAFEANHSVAIIFVTRIKAYENEMSGWLADRQILIKPFGPIVLLQAVERALESTNHAPAA